MRKDHWAAGTEADRRGCPGFNDMMLAMCAASLGLKGAGFSSSGLSPPGSEVESGQEHADDSERKARSAARS